MKNLHIELDKQLKGFKTDEDIKKAIIKSYQTVE